MTVLSVLLHLGNLLEEPAAARAHEKQTGRRFHLKTWHCWQLKLASQCKPNSSQAGKNWTSEGLLQTARRPGAGDSSLPAHCSAQGPSTKSES